MKAIALLLFVASSLCAQVPQSMSIPKFVAMTTGSSSAWTPNLAANALFVWLDTVGTNTVRPYGGVGTDNKGITNWLNIASGHNVNYTQSIGSQPTNFVSGGGASGTTPRVSFGLGSTTSLIGQETTMKLTNWTAVIVFNQSSITGQRELFGVPNVAPYINCNLGKLELVGGATLTGPVSVGTGWIIVTAKFAGASSEIDTNGVLYASGNSGTVGTGGNPFEIAHNTSSQFIGNISRIWVWTNTLSAGDISSAVAQCKTDFGIP